MNVTRRESAVGLQPYKDNRFDMRTGWFAMMKGEKWDRETMEVGMREMYKDIAR